MKHATDYTDCRVSITDPQTGERICSATVKEHNRYTNTILISASNFTYVPRHMVDVLIPIRSQNHCFDGMPQRGYTKSIIQIALSNFEIVEHRAAKRFRVHGTFEAYSALLPPTARDTFHAMNKADPKDLPFELAVTRALPRFEFTILDLSASGALIEVATDRVYVGMTYSFKLSNVFPYELIITARVVRVNATHGAQRELGCVFLTSEKISN